jgi:phage anti-repressor protein
MNQKMLYYFEEHLKNLSKLKAIEFTNIGNLTIKKDFNKFVKYYLQKLSNLNLFTQPEDYINIDILGNNKDYFENLEHLLESIAIAMQHTQNQELIDLGGYYLDRLHDPIDGIQSRKDGIIRNNSISVDTRNNQLRQVFMDMQALLKEMLDNQQIQEFIEEGLWEAYFEFQKNTPAMPSEKIKESLNGYFYQVQADPLKRAFFIAFVALFDYVNQEQYLASKGEQKFDHSVENAGNDNQQVNALQRHWFHRYGAYYPTS